MRYKIYTICLALLLSVCLPAQQRYYFVSPSGNDANSGTVQKPWRTPEAAFAKVRKIMSDNPSADVHLFFRGGEYTIKSPIVVEGSKRLSVSGTKGEKAIFCGDLPIKGWVRCNDSIWVADLKLEKFGDLGEAVSSDNRFDLYFEGERQTLSRWPDEGFTTAGEAMGQTDMPENWTHRHTTAEGVLEYLDSRIDNWNSEKQPYCHGYWNWEWWDNYSAVQMVDTSTRLLLLKQPYDVYGYRDSCHFYGLNLRCELDAPGEYYLDRDTSLLYWYAPSNFKGGDIARGSSFNSPYMMELRGCENLQLENISFRGSRRSAIRIEGGRAVKLSQCRFSDLGDDAVVINGGHDHIIDGCVMEELCCGGISATGGDRKTLESSGFVLSNTTVRDFSLYKRTYEPALYFEGAGMTITHNLFQGGSSSALRIEGNDVDISYNQIFDMVTESDDQGALDVYGNFSYRRITVRYNHWKNITGNEFCGAAAVRFDDMVSGQIVYGNVFEDCGGGKFGAVQINGGKDNYIAGNLFYHCTKGLSMNVWTEERWNTLMAQYAQKLSRVNCFGELYRLRYPELNQPVDYNITVNTFAGNLAVGMTELFNCPDHVISAENTLLPDRESSMESFLGSDVLSAYGLPSIPFAKMGPQK